VHFWSRPDKSLPEAWQTTVAERVAIWSLFDDGERDRLEEPVAHLYGHNHWEAANGFTLTEEMKLVISASAAVLVLNLGIEWYRKIGAIIVHPTTVTRTGARRGPAAGVVTDAPVDILGEANLYGPIILAWDAVARDAADPARGQNVVFHEFAHKLDMLDDLVDGTPPMDSTEELQRWIEVCTAEYQHLRQTGEDPLLDDYAATNVAEFFARTTEVFFTRPADVLALKPDLYCVLADFYRQDPAARVTR
jgi:Mlc titration factor MtfA (ptsG expression regulator)